MLHGTWFDWSMDIEHLEINGGWPDGGNLIAGGPTNLKSDSYTILRICGYV